MFAAFSGFIISMSTPCKFMKLLNFGLDASAASFPQVSLQHHLARGGPLKCLASYETRGSATMKRPASRTALRTCWFDNVVHALCSGMLFWPSERYARRNYWWVIHFVGGYCVQKSCLQSCFGHALSPIGVVVKPYWLKSDPILCIPFHNTNKIKER